MSHVCSLCSSSSRCGRGGVPWLSLCLLRANGYILVAYGLSLNMRALSDTARVAPRARRLVPGLPRERLWLRRLCDELCLHACRTEGLGQTIKPPCVWVYRSTVSEKTFPFSQPAPIPPRFLNVETYRLQLLRVRQDTGYSCSTRIQGT